MPKTCVVGQSLGQNWPPSAYRSYHSSNGTILATNLRKNYCRCWASIGPYLTSNLGPSHMMRMRILLPTEKNSPIKFIEISKSWGYRLWKIYKTFQNKMRNIQEKLSKVPRFILQTLLNYFICVLFKAINKIE